ncbi:type III-B CRISPR module RAMP protein Cmr4 [Deinococcus piscis]|uniref:Type III-B CRISPR module RAMP protein Cmr4 n=1 Tax=Deinococcus piscis TaxID=394230 RepID=A0ABQ3K9S0_9DEIO|nr:type III-B CRISPR module RAMP protein Cmr4 [Deinococcus piscis]
MLLWHALTPVHSGTGQGGTGIIDLPIAREAATGFPMLPASSIKGVLRNGDYSDAANEKFGSLDAAGRLTFTDARLLALPIRSYKGTFAYVTCPLVIRRLVRDMQALKLGLDLTEFPHVVEETEVHLAADALVHSGKVLFEDIDLKEVQCPATKQLAQTLSAWAGIEELQSRLAVVSDDVFSYFAQTATEVSAHIRLEAEAKTVASGALWYEETLPAESLLSSFVIGGAWPADTKVLQVGGKGTVGRGLLQVSEVGK